MDTQEENISVGEAVRRFGIGRTRLYSILNDGQIEAFKLGRRTLIRAESVRSFIDSIPCVVRSR